MKSPKPVKSYNTARPYTAKMPYMEEEKEIMIDKNKYPNVDFVPTALNATLRANKAGNEGGTLSEQMQTSQNKQRRKKME